MERRHWVWPKPPAITDLPYIPCLSVRVCSIPRVLLYLLTSMASILSIVITYFLASPFFSFFGLSVAVNEGDIYATHLTHDPCPYLGLHCKVPLGSRLGSVQINHVGAPVGFAFKRTSKLVFSPFCPSISLRHFSLVFPSRLPLHHRQPVQDTASKSRRLLPSRRPLFPFKTPPHPSSSLIDHQRKTLASKSHRIPPLSLHPSIFLFPFSCCFSLL